LVDKHAPLRSITIVLKPTVPWWSSEIINAKKALRKAEQRWRKKRLAVFYETFITLLTDFSSLLSRFKTDFYRDKVAEQRGDPRRLHQLIDRSLDNKSSPAMPSFSDSKRLCAEFSNFNATKVSNIRTTLDSAVGLQPPVRSSLHAIVMIPVFSSFIFLCVFEYGCTLPTPLGVASFDGSTYNTYGAPTFHGLIRRYSAARFYLTSP
jgi:hypothetical protein